MLDNESNTSQHQQALADAFPAVLVQLSAGGRPDLHVAAITPDMGTLTMSGAQGPSVGSGPGGCFDDGDNGVLKRFDTQTGARFLIDSATETNHAGSLATDIRNIVAVGSTGCGFQQPLSAIRASFANASNAGFRRSTAALAIVVLADEDDCSALDPALFSADTSALGPISHFRCAQFGYACSEADLTTPGPRTNCVPDASSTVLEDPATFLPLLRGQADDPRRVAFGVIAGPSDVSIELRAPSGGSSLIPALAHSCSWVEASNNSDVADPAVRLSWLVDQFGDRGAIGSICSDDLTPAMTTMGINARRAMGDPCIEDDVPLTDCTVSEEVDGVSTPLIACESPSQTDCYELATDPAACPNAAHRELVVHRSSAAPAGYDILSCRPA